VMAGTSAASRLHGSRTPTTSWSRRPRARCGTVGNSSQRVGDAVAVNPTSRPSPTRLALLERLADLIATHWQAIRSGSRSTGWTRPARPAWPTSWSGRWPHAAGRSSHASVDGSTGPRRATAAVSCHPRATTRRRVPEAARAQRCLDLFGSAQAPRSATSVATFGQRCYLATVQP
jgi:hypothetical protein